MAELRFTSGGVQRALILEGAGPVGIGRDADNAVVLDARDVSRRHGRLLADERGWRIEDLGSANGIQVNGERVVFALLRDGARITIGGHELLFVAEVAPEPATAPAEPAVTYFLDRSGQRFGPFSWPQLQELAAEKRVAPEDQVWGPELERWTAARELPGLMPEAPVVQGAVPTGAAAPTRGRAFKVAALLATVTVLVLVSVLLALLLTGGGGDDGGWQSAVLGLDDGDWQSYPDREEEQRQIDESLEGFQSALRAGDVERSVSFVADVRQGAYAALFRNRPEAMPAFADVLERSQMSYLDPARDQSLDTRIRTAEYTVTIDGFDFYIRWAKVDGTWVLFDF